MQGTVVFDFDGVIHSFISGWQGSDTIIPDPPVPGIINAMEEIQEAGYRIIVVSARNRTLAGKEAVDAWLNEHDIPYDENVAYKPPALAYIDDRAIKFDGNTANLLHEIQHMRTWLEPDPDKVITRLRIQASKQLDPNLLKVINDAIVVINNLKGEN